MEKDELTTTEPVFYYHVQNSNQFIFDGPKFILFIHRLLLLYFLLLVP